MAFLEIVASPLGLGLEGRRFELARPRIIFEIGSRASLPIVLPGRATTSRHARIDRVGGEWFLTSFVAPGSWLDGEALPANERARVTHGAVIELGRCGYVLTFNERDPAGRAEELERSIAEAPDDPQRWLVYGDWLQERGDPWGAELVKGPDPEPWAIQKQFRRNLPRMRALGPLMRAVRHHELDVRWSAFNAVSHLGLRAGSRVVTPAETQWLAAHLGHSQAARLATSVDLALTAGLPDPGPGLADALDALARGAPLPALRTLTLGYAIEAGRFALPEASLAELRAKSPHVRLTARDLLPVSTRESLRLLSSPPHLFVGKLRPGDAAPLSRQHEVTLASHKLATLRIIALRGKKAPTGAARLQWDGTCWRVYREVMPVSQRVESTFLRLNDHTVELDDVLLPGDELELGPGIRFRFEIDT